MKTHQGSCHCGAIRFTATLDVATASQCNCTVCTKLGCIGCLTKPELVELTAGTPAEYETAGKVATRYFCSSCGIYCFSKGNLPEIGGPFASVNLNTLDDVDPYTLTLTHWDGRHNNWEAGPSSSPWPIFRAPAAAEADHATA